MEAVAIGEMLQGLNAPQDLRQAMVGSEAHLRVSGNEFERKGMPSALPRLKQLASLGLHFTGLQHVPRLRRFS